MAYIISEDGTFMGANECVLARPKEEWYGSEHDDGNPPCEEDCELIVELTNELVEELLTKYGRKPNALNN